MRKSYLFFSYKQTIATLNGEPITYPAIMDQIRLTGTVRARGGHVNEDPSRSGKKGIVSRADLRRENLFAHVEGQPIGISTSYELNVAIKFACNNFDSRSLANSSVVHFFSHCLMPNKDKSNVADVLKGQICATYERECETVFHRCVPEELYIGWMLPSAFPRFFSHSINFNPLFVDPKIIKWNSELHSLFLNYIYDPYTEDFGPKLGGRKPWVTDFQLANFEKGKKEFHAEYQKTAARFFTHHQQSVEKQLVPAFFSTCMPF